MGDVINLKRVRKQTERDQADKQAEINRFRFGRTKSERKQEQKQAQQASDVLDQHLLARNDSC